MTTKLIPLPPLHAPTPEMQGLCFINASHPNKDWDLPVFGHPTVKILLGSLQWGSSAGTLD